MSTPIHALHVISGDLWAGAEVSVSQLLPALIREGLEVSAVVFNEGRLAKELEKSGVPVRILNESSLSFFALCRSAASTARDVKASLVHAHGYKEQMVADRVRAQTGCPMVRTLHGLSEPFRGFRQWKMRLYQTLEGWSLRKHTAAVIAVAASMPASPQLRGVPENRLHVVHNGMEASAFSRPVNRKSVLAGIGCEAEGPVLGIVGRLTRVKRVDRFLRIAGKVRETIPEARFVVVGEGPLRGELESLRGELGLADWVRFTGHVDNSREIIGALDLLLMTSEHEGIPMTLIEALFLGTPVVAFRVGGIPEVIEDGVQGVLVEPGDEERLARACCGLIRDSSKRNEMSQGGPKRALEAFSAGAMARSVAAVYGMVLGESDFRG